MLNREELEKFKSPLGFNIWQVERDYLQHLFLLFLSKRTANELVFKGGTALQKTFGLNRFSIDMDFTLAEELSAELFSYLEKDFQDFGFPAHSKREKKKNLLKIEFIVQGPLYRESERTLTVLRIEASLREKILLEPETREVFPLYPDLQPYLVKTMNLNEMLAEKVRVILTRNKARDVFDLRFMLKKRVPLNEELINKKLAVYNLKYSKTMFMKKVKSVEKNWQNELSQLVLPIPDFREVVRQIREKI